MWEAPIMEKYGYSVDEILDGSYLLAEGEVVPEITVEDITAVVCCHEIDHLNGIVFTDKATELFKKVDIKK